MADDKSREVKEMKKQARSVGEVTAKLTIDCSDALKGLKAVQREARKATQSLKEFEEAYNETKSIAKKCNVSDQELFSLLARPEVSS